MAKKQVAVTLRKPSRAEIAEIESFVRPGAGEVPDLAVTPTSPMARRSDIRRISPSGDAHVAQPANEVVTGGAIGDLGPHVSDVSHLSGESEREAVAAPPVAPRAPVVLRAAMGAEYREVIVYLPTDLAERLTTHCLEHDRDMSKLVAELVAQHLGGPSGESGAPTTSEVLAVVVRWLRARMEQSPLWNKVGDRMGDVLAQVVGARRRGRET